MTRQQVLEEFLNDRVTRLELSLYSWHGILYEIFPYKQILKKKRLNPSHFIKFQGHKTAYGIREVSPAVYKKYYLDKSK